MATDYDIVLTSKELELSAARAEQERVARLEAEVALLKSQAQADREKKEAALSYYLETVQPADQAKMTALLERQRQILADYRTIRAALDRLLGEVQAYDGDAKDVIMDLLRNSLTASRLSGHPLKPETVLHWIATASLGNEHTEVLQLLALVQDKDYIFREMGHLLHFTSYWIASKARYYVGPMMKEADETAGDRITDWARAAGIVDSEEDLFSED